MKINVVGVRRYKFEDKVTKKEVAGASIFFTAQNDYDNNLLGLETGKINIGEKAADSIDFNQLLNAKECDADFNLHGKLVSIKPNF